jgi:hypothetical protein
MALAACDQASTPDEPPGSPLPATAREASASAGTPSILEVLKKCNKLERVGTSLIARCSNRQMFLYDASNAPYSDAIARANLDEFVASLRAPLAAAGNAGSVAVIPWVVPQGSGVAVEVNAQARILFTIMAMRRTESGTATMTCGGPVETRGDCSRFIDEMSRHPETVLEALRGSITELK